MSKYKHMHLKGEEKFADSIESALRIIDSGLKIGTDNLEMILSNSDVRTLGEMVNILNIAEMDCKQGGRKKYDALMQAVNNYRKGDKDDLRYIFDQCKNLRKEEKRSYKGKNFVITPEDKKNDLLLSLEHYDVDVYHV